MLDKLLFEEEVRLGVGGMVAVRICGLVFALVDS